MEYSPIALFTYKRLDTLKNCISSLKSNAECTHSDLYIFSDGPAKESDIEKVEQVRKYIDTITGFKKIVIAKQKVNKGLANSIIAGVSKVINDYGKVIVLEDDLMLSSNFLAFMNKALVFYAPKKEVHSISGFTLPIKIPSTYHADVYFTQRAFSWGWGSWYDRWNDIDWNVSDYALFSADKKKQSNFNRMGSDMSSMLHKQMRNEINSWAIRWCYHQFRHDLFTAFPVNSKVLNDGFMGDATHTRFIGNRFKGVIKEEGQYDFDFPNEVALNKSIISQFVEKFSIRERIYYKGLGVLNRVLNKIN